MWVIRFVKSQTSDHYTSFYFHVYRCRLLFVFVYSCFDLCRTCFWGELVDSRAGALLYCLRYVVMCFTWLQFVYDGLVHGCNDIHQVWHTCPCQNKPRFCLVRILSVQPKVEILPVSSLLEAVRRHRMSINSLICSSIGSNTKKDTKNSISKEWSISQSPSSVLLVRTIKLWVPLDIHSMLIFSSSIHTHIHIHHIQQ